MLMWERSAQVCESLFSSDSYMVLQNHAWVGVFKREDRPMDFIVTEYKKFIERVLISHGT